MWPKAFSSREAEVFARDLANSILDDLGVAGTKAGAKFRDRAGKVLVRADRQVAEFKAKHRLNWFQRSRAANAFLWTLKGRECPADYADELTEWLVVRL